MKTFNLFVVELDRTINDTITTSGGLELYIDNRFNEFENRVTEGPVVAVPFTKVSHLLVMIITTLSGTIKTTLSIIKLLALKVAVLVLSNLLRVGAFLNPSKKRKFKNRKLSKLLNLQRNQQQEVESHLRLLGLKR
jgi:hypothetical protein